MVAQIIIHARTDLQSGMGRTPTSDNPTFPFFEKLSPGKSSRNKPAGHFPLKIPLRKIPPPEQSPGNFFPGHVYRTISRMPADHHSPWAVYSICSLMIICLFQNRGNERKAVSYQSKDS